VGGFGEGFFVGRFFDKIGFFVPNKNTLTVRIAEGCACERSTKCSRVQIHKFE